MKQVLIKSGSAHVAQIPAPEVGSGNILVQVQYSCISAGTEMAGLKMSGLPLYQRALKQPENVKRVVEMVRDQGVRRTMNRVSGKLASGTPTGYSAAGIVIQIGDSVNGFSVGDRVACAGAGIANHAEFIDVPVNLAVKVPDAVSLEQASTVTLGAIALQGVRRASPTLGETIVVVGLGILGQLTAQMLQANGCQVIGVDFDASRIDLAQANGLNVAINPSEDNYIDRVLKHTGGYGADAVIITAAGSSSQIVSDAMNACRKKGRVIVVGDIGLDLKRSDFYAKELDFLISTSYGPGRYDPVYEQEGQDYPIAYVRWTENRNMQAYLELLAQEKLRLKNLIHASYDIADAEQAYEALKAEGEKPLIVLLSYPKNARQPDRCVALESSRAAENGPIVYAVVGGSSFVQGIHLPNMQKLSKFFQLKSVMSRTGTNAQAIAKQYEARYCTTDYEEILQDQDINLVLVSPRHDLHGSLVLQALTARKHVFVEKPLTIHKQELDQIEAFYRENPDGPLLMVGYNRRFSPAMQKIKQLLADRTTPLIANYRMNAGYIDPDHWVHGAEGGGRNLGEACHIYDLFDYLCDASSDVTVSATAIDTASPQWAKNDNFVATLKYKDGSVCNLVYTALGNKTYPKEQMEVFADGKVITLKDYKSVEVHGSSQKGWSSSTADKGHFQQMEQLANALTQGKAWPIALNSLIATSRVSFEVERQIFSRSGLTRFEG